MQIRKRNLALFVAAALAMAGQARAQAPTESGIIKLAGIYFGIMNNYSHKLKSGYPLDWSDTRGCLEAELAFAKLFAGDTPLLKKMFENYDPCPTPESYRKLGDKAFARAKPALH